MQGERGAPAARVGAARRAGGERGGVEPDQQALASAPGAASVRVWEVTSSSAPADGDPPAETTPDTHYAGYALPTIVVIRGGPEVARLDGLITDGDLAATFDREAG